MNPNLPNPFNVTKAVDFSDQQISDYWVDLPGGVGFRELMKPASPMPMLILGGKGSGKTHLLRYFSYPLQRLRNDDLAAGLRDEGYVGIYLRCGGLNASRFSGKGQSDEAWATLFQQYMDLWLAQLYLETMTDAITADQLASHETKICTRVTALSMFRLNLDRKRCQISGQHYARGSARWMSPSTMRRSRDASR